MKTNRNAIIRTMTVLAMLLATSATGFGQDDDKNWSNTPFEIKEVDAVKALVIHNEVTVAEIGPAMAEMYSKLFAYLEANELQPAGPPFSVYYTWDPEGKTSFDVGVPVQKKVKASGDVAYKEFESIKAVSTLYTGAYENMEAVYNNMMAYLEKEKIEPGYVWEVYLTDPESTEDPNQNQTMIYFQIKK